MMNIMIIKSCYWYYSPFTPEFDIYARSSDRYCAKADQYGINEFTDLASKNLGLSIAALILKKISWFLDDYAN